MNGYGTFVIQGGVIIIVYSGIKIDVSQITFYRLMNLDAVPLAPQCSCLEIDICTSPDWLPLKTCSLKCDTSGWGGSADSQEENIRKQIAASMANNELLDSCFSGGIFVLHLHRVGDKKK